MRYRSGGIENLWLIIFPRSEGETESVPVKGPTTQVLKNIRRADARQLFDPVFLNQAA